jgi:hypothetical protein
MKVGQGTYGNRQSGKTFSYYVPDNARQGQKFRVEAYNERAKRVIQTMWTLTVNPVVPKGGGGYGEETINRQLARQDAETRQTGVNLRTVLDNDTLALPGGQKYQEIAQQRGLSDTQAKALWSLTSNIRQDERTKNAEGWTNRSIARERLLGLNTKQDNTEAVRHIMGE